MYKPKQGDICYIDFEPTKGHEQSGFRPAVVISNNLFNKYTNMVIVCPITSKSKKFPTHYELCSTNKINGYVLCQHIRTLDYKERNIKFIEKIDELELDEILDIVGGLIEK